MHPSASRAGRPLAARAPPLKRSVGGSPGRSTRAYQSSRKWFRQRKDSNGPQMRSDEEQLGCLPNRS